MYRVARQENMPTLRNVSRRPSREYAEEAEQRSLVRAATPALGSRSDATRKLANVICEVLSGSIASLNGPEAGLRKRPGRKEESPSTPTSTARLLVAR